MHNNGEGFGMSRSLAADGTAIRRHWTVHICSFPIGQNSRGKMLAAKEGCFGMIGRCAAPPSLDDKSLDTYIRISVRS
jgi:hypothetical protein